CARDPGVGYSGYDFW
nr:immunoglobulin heavy chain junction region [Macaca mulatta]MOV48964.1 immunoglobulin heavy chain junction region [Macaca mulatta]MOV49151.1 immunoglobulin heavy chain junction region [Macaca mulatta]MOV49325.1 immunoglobulin heavy chain junction region [Macaca mulatta]MOV49509.1 immunoglobulin heavy chain junction region [Macaca mulatta]